MESEDGDDVKAGKVPGNIGDGSGSGSVGDVRAVPKTSSDKENNLTINGVCVMNSASYVFAKNFEAMNKSPVSDKQEDKNESIL